MARFSDEEIKALQEKERNKEKNVICPRCGKHLKYIEKGNSYEIKCETDYCLHFAVRGL